jgi:mRNA-degrading endonuclease RelE of RelBE toxin-antitoxin system
MRHEILIAPQAMADLKALRAGVRTEVKAAIERHLRHEPMKQSKSRIKRLRGLSRPQFRLRVGDIRVFYDVREARVEILAIVAKDYFQVWLEREGENP